LVYNRYLLGMMIGCQFFHCWVFKNFKSSALKKKMSIQFLQEINVLMPKILHELNDSSHWIWKLVVSLIATQEIVSIDVLFSVKNKLWTYIQYASMDIYFDLMTFSS
jgi:hypothetical protein